MNVKKMQKEHDKQNEAFLAAKMADEKPETLAVGRLDELCKVLDAITGEDMAGAGSYVGVVDMLVSFFDDIVVECIALTGRRVEIEEKLLNLCKLALTEPTKNGTRDTNNEHVVAVLIDAVLFHEAKHTDRADAMERVLLHETNPLRLGLVSYEQFCEKNRGSYDKQVLEYLKTEEEARFLLMQGHNVPSTKALERLVSMPINTPEKYMLFSLNAFCNGFKDEAINAVELGLKTFPGDMRLLAAKSGFPV